MVGARLVLAVLAVTGCTARFHGLAVQPNPVKEPVDTLRKSETIRIVTGDMELNRPVSNGCNGSSDCNATTYHNEHYPLINTASFTLVSRDRLRFHVQIDHKWIEYADLKTWNVELLDDLQPAGSRRQGRLHPDGRVRRRRLEAPPAARRSQRLPRQGGFRVLPARPVQSADQVAQAPGQAVG
jgi:hypothetical protein